MKRFPLIIAGLLFGLFALAHLARLYYGFPLIIGTTVVPLWVSGIGILVGITLAYWMLSSACCCRCPTCEKK